ncbi:MAG: AAA family ATPase [Crocinitomicaceae bacterium]|jgi:exodeoxyribonuclease-5|nr:AAA family ATPase [Crocinitomicaceae bacterium]MBT5403918.1 AAA family ATPase [Crocinitomicaceae bacterium]MBT6515364.1 AAA family ATPase [Crocinitomicaceae bacterium]
MKEYNSIEITVRFKKILQTYFEHQPTLEQSKLFLALSTFLFNDPNRSVFLIKGYAGTGKTSAVGALVKTLPEFNTKTVLLAPTGRAAKVMANYACKPASTIHRKLYFKTSKGGTNYFALMQNLHKNTLFIVDEASMISVKRGVKNPFEEERSILDDLIKYVYQGDGCKLLLVGDIAQLPPVMEEQSYALDSSYLKKRYALPIVEVVLKEVMRQMKESGILFNSFQIRSQQDQLIETKKGTVTFPSLKTAPFKDVIKISGYDLEDELDINLGNKGVENCVVITRSNKRANQFNQQIRTRILWHEDEISTGDFLMVVKNNYTWLNEESKAGFIANGDTIEVLKIVGFEEVYQRRFANVICRLVDYPDESNLEVKLLLDTIMIDGPNLPRNEMKAFFHEVENDYMEFSNRKQRIKKVLDNPYFNALQVKFAYAVTCHKSQGGQWPVVFIDQGYITEELLNKEYLRWLYTAITRAQEKVYLINFHASFFPEEQSD